MPFKNVKKAIFAISVDQNLTSQHFSSFKIGRLNFANLEKNGLDLDHCTATEKKRKLTFEVKYRIFCRSKAFENAKKIIALFPHFISFRSNRATWWWQKYNWNHDLLTDLPISKGEKSLQKVDYNHFFPIAVLKKM